LNKLQRLVRDELSGHKAWQHANYMTQFMRTPRSSGIRETISYARSKLEKFGLDNLSTVKYPSKDYGTEDLSFIGWDINDARLEVVEPVSKVITSYDEAPTCIQHWSISTPTEGVTADLVDVGRGVDDSDYVGRDVKGKIVLASGDGHAEGNSQAYLLAVEKYGAIGLVTDTLIYQQPPFRVRENHPDAISLLRVPSRRGMGWAFVISHTQGEYLRSLLREGPVKLKAFIDAENFQGEGEELVGEIRGSEMPDQQIWFVAHSSGTKPGGNCAGGVGLWIENARAITALIKQGKVPRPKRTIKFLLGAEGGGLNAYLTSHPDESENVVAAFVYCSVGNDQCKCNSSLILYKSPESIPSFVNDLCIDTIEKVSKDGLPPFKDKTRDIKLIRFNVLPYTPWSDNSRLMRLRVPCPLFMSWPSQHFHTQFFTADKVDPAVLKRCGEVTTSVALTIANAGVEEAKHIAYTVEAKGRSRLINVSMKAYDEVLDILEDMKSCDKSKKEVAEKMDEVINYRNGELNYLTEITLGALESVKNLVGDPKLHKEIDELKSNLMDEKKLETAKIEGYRSLLLEEA